MSFDPGDVRDKACHEPKHSRNAYQHGPYPDHVKKIVRRGRTDRADYYARSALPHFCDRSVLRLWAVNPWFVACHQFFLFWGTGKGRGRRQIHS